MDAKTLALYFGSKFRFKLIGPLGDHDGFSGWMNLVPDAFPECCRVIDNVQLLLRPLSSMTEEEATQWLRMENNSDVFFKTDEWYSQLNDARKTSWLLSKGFDLFGLLEKGEAIESPNKGEVL